MCGEGWHNTTHKYARINVQLRTQVLSRRLVPFHLAGHVGLRGERKEEKREGGDWQGREVRKRKGGERGEERRDDQFGEKLKEKSAGGGKERLREKKGEVE